MRLKADVSGHAYFYVYSSNVAETSRDLAETGDNGGAGAGNAHGRPGAPTQGGCGKSRTDLEVMVIGPGVTKVSR